MSLHYFPGTELILLDRDFKPAGEVVVDYYMQSEKMYRVWWTYEQTGERELIKVPEFRLLRKPSVRSSPVIR